MITRRDLLKTAAALPAAAVLRSSPAFAKPVVGHQAPYLALEKYILPGNDEFPEEKTACEIERALHEALRSGNLPAAADVKGVSPEAMGYVPEAPGVESPVCNLDNQDVIGGWQRWVRSLGSVRRAEFHSLPDGQIRYSVASRRDGSLLYRTGFWTLKWSNGKIVEFLPNAEYIVKTAAPLFRDVTAAVFENVPAFPEQLTKGVPYWRSRLDPASGIDVYGSNGIAVGDIDGDGEDEVYVCQPGGLPNRLLKFHDDGTLRDITEEWNVALLDDTSSALFIDARNTGRQDLIVLRGSGPLLFLNEGGKFRLRTDAFEFASVPAGTFTGMAAADFDRDGKLDLYLCCYVYFLSEAQYTYATPYHDARNGPPNFLFRNRLNEDGSGAFVDCTTETGMDENNNRFSFAPAWCDFNGDGWPDLFVANDFGHKNLYINREGHFRDLAQEAGLVGVGPGMSASWFDYDGDGNADLYVANMWTAAGQRVVTSPKFEPVKRNSDLTYAYWGHTMGNSLYRNKGNGTFEDLSRDQNVQFGRWAWASGGHDFDNDGVPEIFVTCGMLTNESDTDLDSFFWRQVVAKSPVTAQHSEAYENGWNAINQFLREKYSWNGREPNVLYVKRGSHYYDFSGVSGLDFAEDGRAFAVVDFDGDGRPDIFLKSRLGPQVRVFQNNCAGDRHSIGFDLVGTKSNRDAIGARVQVDKQTKWLDAGSGFLSQHSKRMLFGLGASDVAKNVRVTWPSGATQEFENLKAGFVYRLTEGSNQCKSRPFHAARKLASVPVKANNELRLDDTWFEEAIPLPEKQKGPGLFTLTAAELAKDPQRRQKYEIFRRYLFDWRTELMPPLSLLLNADGRAVKIYAETPSSEQVRIDLDMLASGKIPGQRFAGFYVHQTHRDFFKFGAAYLWAGFPDQALPYLERVLEHSPNNARVQTVVGRMYLDDERLNEAEQAFRRALEVNKDNAEALNGLGLTLAKQGRSAEAKEDFEQAIALRRDYSEAINNLGVLYVQQGKVNDAISAFNYGIQVAPDEDILYLNLGRIYVQAGNLERARQVMQWLLNRKPDSATARQALMDLNSR